THDLNLVELNTALPRLQSLYQYSLAQSSVSHPAWPQLVYLITTHSRPSIWCISIAFQSGVSQYALNGVSHRPSRLSQSLPGHVFLPAEHSLCNRTSLNPNIDEEATLTRVNSDKDYYVIVVVSLLFIAGGHNSLTHRILGSSCAQNSVGLRIERCSRNSQP
ncbi:hypothetical protein HAX54_044204, partial [Datura stramonium]|nr:hypothetical protein [Datura stramonium]